MADDRGEYDFDLELYCIVCDRQIDPHAAPLPTTTATSLERSPSASASHSSSARPSASTSSSRQGTSVYTTPAPPHPTPSSAKSNHAVPPAPPASQYVAPKLKRTGSGHSTTSNGTGHKSSHAVTAHGHGHGTVGGLKRNKSLGKVHHAAGGAHRRNHSHANLHALAPMTNGGGGGTGGGAKKVTVTAVGPAAEKEKGKDKERGIAKDAARSQPFDVASTLYCSVECKRIDEARNQLALAHLGSSNSPSPIPFPLSSSSPTGDFGEGEPHAAMIRRRSSGVSSSASTSYAFSSTGDRGLSPIMSAAPTSNPAPYLDSSGFPFPSVSSSSSTFARHSPQSVMVSHPSNSSLNSLPSQQSYQGPAPLLNFSSRRQSKGAHSSGAYSYRPSLMERVHSTDSADSGVSDTRNARSLSIGGGSVSAGLFNRVRSMDGLVMMGRSDSESSERDGRLAQSHRPPSALSSLRSMTPILNGPPPVSANRSRPPLASNRVSEPAISNLSSLDDRPPAPRIASDSVASSESRSRSRSRKSHHPSVVPSRARSRPPPTTSPLLAGSDPPHALVGSLPSTRSRGLSFGSPTSTTSLLRPIPVAPSEPLLANRRTSSSASLALLGTSLSRSHDHRSGLLANWASLKRTDSTAGLSGLNAVGEISAPSASSPPPSSSSTASTFIPAPSTYQQRHQMPSRHHDRPRRPSSSHSHPHSSPSSASSFGPSQSSVRTSSSRRSTAASSDHWQGAASTSFGSNAGKSTTSGTMYRTRSGSSSRPDRTSSAGGGIIATSSSAGGVTTAAAGGGGGSSNRIKQGGLTMTPSHTNLANIAPPSPGPRPHSSLAPSVPPTTASAKQGLGHIASSTTTTNGPTSGGGGGGPPASRTWSWTNLHVPTYQALDVTEYRARKERIERGGSSSNADEPNGHQVDLVEGEGLSPLKKERKRLFYFSDNME